MKYWTTAEAAKIVELSPITIRWYIQQGKIKARKFGRDWKISTSTIDKLLMREKRHASNN